VSRFVPEDYKPDGGFSPLGLPVLLVALCVAAVALGWVVSFIGQWFYLILIFPLAIGLGLVVVGLFLGHLCKMRSLAVSGLLGLIASVVALVAMHYFDYRREFSGVPTPTFLGYLDLKATQGVEISSRGGSGLNLGYVGTWVYWAVEFLAVAALATLGLVGGAAAPFCPACNSWKVDRKLGTLRARGGDLVVLFREGEIDRLADHEPLGRDGELIVTAAVCPNCGDESPIDVKVEERTKDGEGNESTNELAHLTYPGEALAEFEAVFGQSGGRKRKRR
jgi:hypothetical protein